MPTIEVPVAEGANDGSIWWNGSTWNINLTTVRQQVGYASATALKFGGGLRFLNVSIPPGSTIDAAHLIIVAENSNALNNVNSVIIGEANASPAAFSTLANYQARRGTIVGGANDDYLTTASVPWNVIPAWTAGATYNSPDISSILQEFVDLFDGIENVVLFWDD